MIYIRYSRNRFRMFDNGLINPIYRTFSSHIGIEENHTQKCTCSLWDFSKVLLPFPLFQV